MDVITWRKFRAEIMQVYDFDVLMADGSVAHRYVTAGADKTPEAVQAAADSANAARAKLVSILDSYEATESEAKCPHHPKESLDINDECHQCADEEEAR